MEKVNINHIMKEFDSYVQNYLQKKDSQQQQQQEPQTNQLDQYFQTMEKRLKLKTVANYQKFENLLAPMKKLKSFVSIKTFLRELNVKTVQPNLKSQNKQFKRKLQYEGLRGGYYMQKIQNHLRNNNLKRKLDSQAQMLLHQLQSNPTERNEYTMWIENVLGKINLKQQTFLKIQNSQQQQQQKQNLQVLLSNNHKCKILKNNSKQQFLKRKSIQDKQQKNFKKVGDFLSQRLRKILIDKYGSINNKKINRNIQFCQSQQEKYLPLNGSNKKTCRTAGISKRIRINTQDNVKRAQTSQIKGRNNQNIWKTKLNCKINNILNQADIQVKKGKQQIARLNVFRNSLYGQEQQPQF